MPPREVYWRVTNMRLYLRALSYFRQDLPLVLLLLVVIFASAGLGLLVAWPMAILVDSVPTPAPNTTTSSTASSSRPSPKTSSARSSASPPSASRSSSPRTSRHVPGVPSKPNQLQRLLRVRCDLYRKLQALNLAYHRANPQGDAIYRLSSDTFACQTILQTIIAAAVAAVTLVTMGAVLMSRSVPLTLLALSIAPMLAAANVVFGRRLKQRSLECKE